MNPEHREFLIRWAHDNKVVFNEEGEVGIGRDCVGMTRNGHYVDLPDDIYTDLPDAETGWPGSPEHAYHKHDCLCVLGHGDERLEELYEWVVAIDKAGYVVDEVDRPPAGDIINLLFHGATRVVLVKADSR